jgi:hypothetical protein
MALKARFVLFFKNSNCWYPLHKNKIEELKLYNRVQNVTISNPGLKVVPSNGSPA